MPGHPFGTRLVYLSDHKPVETTAPETPVPTLDIADRLKRFLHVLIEPRSYLNAIYLLTAFPLGLTYFLVLTAGMISGAFLSIIAVGLLILLATIVAAWGFALFERELAVGLLGFDVPPLSLPDPEIVSPWRVSHFRSTCSTWSPGPGVALPLRCWAWARSSARCGRRSARLSRPTAAGAS